MNEVIRMIQRLKHDIWFVVLFAVLGVGAAQAQTVTYIHTDALGSVVAESDASGKVIKRYDYEPYGRGRWQRCRWAGVYRACE